MKNITHINSFDFAYIESAVLVASHGNLCGCSACVYAMEVLSDPPPTHVVKLARLAARAVIAAASTHSIN